MEDVVNADGTVEKVKNEDGTINYEALAKVKAANGRTLQECYIAGLDPTNEASKFTAKIEIVDGKPVISCEPYLENQGRRYITEGKTNLADENWAPADEGKHRFFRVRVELE